MLEMRPFNVPNFINLSFSRSYDIEFLEETKCPVALLNSSTFGEPLHHRHSVLFIALLCIRFYVPVCYYSGLPFIL